MTLAGRVSPFGNPRIKACSRLPMAYRSVPRPSSPLDAKASTKRPSLLEIRTPKQPVDRTVPARRQGRGRLGEDSHAHRPWRGRAHRLRNQETHHAHTRTTCPNQCLLTMYETALFGFKPDRQTVGDGPGACLLKPGGAGRARTDDLLLAKQALSRLSYGPCPERLPASARGTARPCGRQARDNWWAWIDLNYRPHPYQGCALTD